MIEKLKKWWLRIHLKDKPTFTKKTQKEIEELEQLCYKPLDYKKDKWEIRSARRSKFNFLIK